MACAALAARAQEGDEHALSVQGVAGEIMDTAVEHCRRGERDKALAMFGAIREQLDPPPPILKLIRDFEQTGCTGQRAARIGTWRVQAGGGWDSNVSQGISARSLTLGTPGNTIDLELDPSYRPRSSAYTHASVDYSLSIPDLGMDVRAALGHRKNFSAPAFDLTTSSLWAARDFPAGRLPGVVRLQGDMSEVWLGSQHYQRNQTASAQWIQTNEAGAWVGTLSVSGLHYLKQRSQSSVVWELGVTRELRVAAGRFVSAGVSLQKDDATGQRPGGDRNGFQVELGGLAAVEGWRVRPQVAYTRWLSQDIFAPGLLEVRRRNHLVQASVVAERPLTAQTSLVLEWRGRWSHDNIALYTYRAQSLNAALAARF